MKRTFKYRMYANQETLNKIDYSLRLCRNLYNVALEQKIGYWKQHHERLSSYQQMNQLPELRASFPEYKNINAQVLQNVIERLDSAYIKFFKMNKLGEKKGFPRFKGMNRYDSLTLKNQCGWELNGKYLTLSKIGRFKLHLSRPIIGKIQQITIKRSPANKWYAYFICDNVPCKQFPATKREVGLDMGVRELVVDSDNLTIDNPLFLNQSQAKLRRQQRRLSRRKLYSNRWRKAKLQVVKTYEKISNQRSDYLNKVANYYIDNYNIIYIEDLDIRSIMSDNGRIMRKSILDSSWGILAKLLEEKAEEAGRIVFRIPAINTSKMCSHCGRIVQKDRHVLIHRCPYCGLVMDRDLNAAKNILRQGHRLLALKQDRESMLSQRTLGTKKSRYAAGILDFAMSKNSEE